MRARQATVRPAAPWTGAFANAAASSSPLICPASRSLARPGAANSDVPVFDGAAPGAVITRLAELTRHLDAW